MPRLAARQHSLRFLILHTHNLIEQERGGFAITFYVRVKRKLQTVYAATLSVLRGVLY